MASESDAEKLRKKIEAGYKGNPTDDKTARPSPVARSVIEIPQSVLDEYRTNQKKQKRDNKKNPHIARAAVWGAFIYAAIAVFQWLEMNKTVTQTQELVKSANIQVEKMIESNRTNREALTSVQRAFITAGNMAVGRFVDSNKVTKFQFFAQWENSGVTPTRRAIQHVSYKPDVKPLPKNFSYPDLWSEEEPKKNVPFIFGPKQSIFSSQFLIDPVIIEAVKSRKLHLYFWGWLRYFDIFENTPEHITRFCREYFVDGDPLNPSLNFQNRFVSSCPNYDCIDNECKQQ